MRVDEADPADAEGQLLDPPAFHIIVLGAGGGPTEDNVTGLLVRSTSTQWSKGSVLAVDAGIHLAAIIKILEEHLPNAIPRTPPRLHLLGRRARSKSNGNNGVPAGLVSHASNPSGVLSPGLPDGGKSTLELTTGPFASLEVPFESARANAAHILRYLIPTYLISHPHLDHVSGFAVNTASFQQTSFPKRLAALPTTVEAIKDHIFNDIIWPNLSDEDGGVGLVTYMRLQEGGNVALGVGDGQGYIEICDGLTVKCWSISHGTCMRRHHHRGSHADTISHNLNSSSSGRGSRNETPPTHDRNYSLPMDRVCVSDSTAFFLRDDNTGREVLIFGDVEPDSISLTPRTKKVWTEAAPKIGAGNLHGILIECSYDDSQPDKALFGHLNPRHLIAELQVLAAEVANVKYGEEVIEDKTPPRKRKRQSNLFKTTQENTQALSVRGRAHSQATRRRKRGSSVSPASTPAKEDFVPLLAPEIEGAGVGVEPTADEGVVASRRPSRTKGVLQGVRVIVIHVKDNLKDGPHVGDTILSQLEAYERDVQLGCAFEISEAGTSIWL